MSIEQSEPLFSPKELADNQRAKAELIDACISQESVLVAGAGLSKRLGYPLWNELLGDLRGLSVSLAARSDGRLQLPDDCAGDPLCYADQLRAQIEARPNGLARYHAFLRKRFERRGPRDALHRQLIELPFRGIVTTNYDPALDDELAASQPGNSDCHFVVDQEHAPDIARFLASLRLRTNHPRQVAHLHGRFDSPKSIILTESEYRQCYGHGLTTAPGEAGQAPNWTIHRKFLWTLLATRAAVFMGFSMDDPYLKRMLQTVVKDLWQWDDPPHFAVMALSADRKPAKDKAQLLRSDYGVAVVFYDNSNGRHSGLESLVQEICDACRVVTRRQLESEEQPPKAPSHVPRGMQQWMQKINQRTRARGGAE
jgi:hypothetical protein